MMAETVHYSDHRHSSSPWLNFYLSGFRQDHREGAEDHHQASMGDHNHIL
jgi:hypothetical protein